MSEIDASFRPIISISLIVSHCNLSNEENKLKKLIDKKPFKKIFEEAKAKNASNSSSAFLNSLNSNTNNTPDFKNIRKVQSFSSVTTNESLQSELLSTESDASNLTIDDDLKDLNLKSSENDNMDREVFYQKNKNDEINREMNNAEQCQSINCHQSDNESLESDATGQVNTNDDGLNFQKSELPIYDQIKCNKRKSLDPVEREARKKKRVENKENKKYFIDKINKDDGYSFDYDYNIYKVSIS